MQSSRQCRVVGNAAAVLTPIRSCGALGPDRRPGPIARAHRYRSAQERFGAPCRHCTGGRQGTSYCLRGGHRAVPGSSTRGHRVLRSGFFEVSGNEQGRLCSGYNFQLVIKGRVYHSLSVRLRSAKYNHVGMIPHPTKYSCGAERENRNSRSSCCSIS